MSKLRYLFRGLMPFSAALVSLDKVEGHFNENPGFKVGAALRRGELPGQMGRRSEIGSHSPRIPQFSSAAVNFKRSWGTFM